MSQQIQTFDFSVDLLRALLWQYNDATRLETLVRQKQQWYDENQRDFWANWYRDVFDLRTANDFGLAVWAIILNIPLAVASAVDPLGKPVFGFGAYYENFSNGNFASISSSQLSTEQKRLVLRLRYFQLVTRGTIPEINALLKYVFGNKGGPALAPGLYPQYAPTDVARSIRGSVASYVDAAGLVRFARNDEPRFDYSPLTRSQRGLLVEGPATNLLSYSADFVSSTWHKNQCSTVFAAGASPSGESANLITATGTTNTFFGQTNEALSLAGYYATFSLWIKPGTYSGNFILWLRDGTEANVAFAIFSLNGAGAVWPQTGSAAISPYANGWYRLSVTGLFSASATPGFRVWVDPSATPVLGETYYAWGAQLETGNSPSSYFPTLAAPATRAADEIHISDPDAAPNAYVNDGYNMTARYVFEFPLSSALEMVLTEYDLLPRPAGVKIDYVVIGDADGWGFGRYHENFTNGNFSHA